MTWPTTPAGTTHLDSGDDNPDLARPDIKQNIDNVNAIISEFGTVAITTPQSGQALVWNGSSWINSGAAGTRRATLSWEAANSPWAIQSDVYSLVDSVSGVNITLAAGTYRFKISGIYNVYHSNPSPEPTLNALSLYDTTDDSIIENIDHTMILHTAGATIRCYGVGGVIVDTFAVTTQVSIYHTVSAEQAWSNLSVEISEA